MNAFDILKLFVDHILWERASGDFELGYLTDR